MRTKEGIASLVAITAMSLGSGSIARGAVPERASFNVEVSVIDDAVSSSCPADNWSAHCVFLSTLDTKAHYLLEEVKSGKLLESEAGLQLDEARSQADIAEIEAEKREVDSRTAATASAVAQDRQRLADDHKEEIDRQAAERRRQVQLCKTVMWGRPTRTGSFWETLGNVNLCELDPQAPLKLPPPGVTQVQIVP